MAAAFEVCHFVPFTGRRLLPPAAQIQESRPDIMSVTWDRDVGQKWWEASSQVGVFTQTADVK